MSMIKMPCKPLQKVTSTNAAKMCPNVAKTSLSEVLQSDAVKRLFSQPNLVIKTVPLNNQSSKNTPVNNALNELGDDIATYLNNQKDLKVSIVPVEVDKGEAKRSINFLPSKRDGKSEISVVPIKREKKECGHYEPCEKIICEVAIRNYADEEGEIPMLAINIDEDEIDAPVSKHCSNKACDALSIDHNRCRRALIRLHRCDKPAVCDICGITFKTRKAHLQHKKCVRRDEYRHNEKHGPEILKDRMRGREMEMLEASKTKKNDYMDPVMGYNHAIETLKKNDELIVITKTVPHQQPGVNVTSTSNTDQGSSQRDTLRKMLSSVPIMLPQQNSVILARRINKDEKDSVPGNQGTLQDVLKNNFVTAPMRQSTTNSQYVRLPGVTQNSMQPMALNNLLISHPHIVTTSATQSKPFLTPIRVVPITNLITPPSLLHQTQGIPRFCIMADNEASVLTPQSTNSTGSAATTAVAESGDAKVQSQKSTTSKSPPKKKMKEKQFVCKYCSKHFSVDWYFRTHVAMHKEETLLPCSLCEQTFYNRYDIKKHLMSDHRNESIPCDVCSEQMASYPLYEKHMKTHSSTKSYRCSKCETICTSGATLKFHMQHRHGLVECKRCCEEMPETELADHMATEHKRVKTKVQKIRKRDILAYKKARQRELREAKLLNGADKKVNSKIEQSDVKQEPEDEQSSINDKDNSITKNSLIPPSVEDETEKSESMSEENLL